MEFLHVARFPDEQILMNKYETTIGGKIEA